MRLATVLRLLTVAIVAVQPLAALTAPETINFQGRLTDNTPSQTPIDAIVPMSFSIWDAAVGGSKLWFAPDASQPGCGAVTAIDVAVENGLFSLRLGASCGPIPASVFEAPSRFVEVVLHPALPNQEVLAPRLALTSVGFALAAEKAASAGLANDAGRLGGVPAGDYLLATGTAADSQRLGGVLPSGYLAASGTAANSSQLGGVAASGWQRALSPANCDGGLVLAGFSQSGSPNCISGSGFALPWSGSAASGGPAFAATNSGAGTAGDFSAAGTGHGVTASATDYSAAGVRATHALHPGVYGALATVDAGVLGRSTEPATPAMLGLDFATDPSGGVGVKGLSWNGAGVRGDGGSWGVDGWSAATGVRGNGATGVHGLGQYVGVRGETGAESQTGVIGLNSHPNGGIGVKGQVGQGSAVFGLATATGYGVYGSSAAGTGVLGISAGATGVYGVTTAESMVGVFGANSNPNSGYGVMGQVSVGQAVYGEATSSGWGVHGKSLTNYGVFGESTDGFAVVGNSPNNYGVAGFTGSLATAGVAAVGAGPTGVALHVSNGGIRVKLAGENTPTAAFYVTSSQNCLDPSYFEINNPSINGNPNLMLFVTPASFMAPPVAAVYDEFGSACTPGRWVLDATGAGGDLSGSWIYNILVIRRQ